MPYHSQQSNKPGARLNFTPNNCKQRCQDCNTFFFTRYVKALRALSQLDLQHEDCKSEQRGLKRGLHHHRLAAGYLPVGRLVEGGVTVLSLCRSQSWWTIAALQTEPDSICVRLWPTTDPDLLSDAEPNHAVLLSPALQLWVPRGHFHRVEVKTV